MDLTGFMFFIIEQGVKEGFETVYFSEL